MIQEFECSRNTIRSAIGELVNEGYVQTMQGKGVRNIFQSSLQTTFVIGGIESFKESAERNNQTAKTEVIQFVELIVDKKIAEKSIYDYLENTLGVTIVNSKRVMTVEKMNQIDEKYMELGDYNCLAVVSSQTYNSDGVMFEYTQSRHRPDYFRFQENATRRMG